MYKKLLIPILIGNLCSFCNETAKTKVTETDAAVEETVAEEINSSSLAVYVTEKNPLAKSTPFELQVISPTQSTGEILNSGSLNVSATLTDEDSDSYMATMKKRLTKLIADDPTKCTLNLDFTPKAKPDCANKTASATPTSKSVVSEFIIFPDNIQEGRLGSEQSDPMAQRVLDDTTGIISATEGDQSCSKTVGEYYVDRTASSINMAQDIVTSLLCVANNDESVTGLPEAGASFDLLTLASGAWGSSTLDIKKAEISNTGTTAAPKYRTIFSAIRTNAQNDQTKIVIDTLNIPDATNKENYSGRFLVYDQRRVDGVTTPTIISTVYAKESSRLKIKVRETGLNFDEEIVNMIDTETGLVDYAKILALDNNSARGPSQAIYDLSTEDGTGSVAYASSPALFSDEVAHAFVISVSKDTDSGVLSGCGLHGHTTSLVDENNNSVDSFSIKGKHCLKNQSITGGQSYGGDLNDNQFASLFAYVQQQCFSLNDSGVWTNVSSKLTWAVAENCGAEDEAYAGRVDLIPLAEGLASITLPNEPAGTGIDFSTTELDYAIELKSDAPPSPGP